jgi:hypothetical protein
MRHPTEGALRRLLDEPAGVADADREHVAGCPSCLVGVAAARDDADRAGAALTIDADLGDLDVDAAWQRLVDELEAEGGRHGRAATPGRRWRAALRGPRLAGVAVVALLAGAGAAAAADWLQIFRTEQVAPIRITQADLVKLPDLSSYGAVDLREVPEVREVADAAAAAEQTGLAVPQVGALPRGVTGSPAFQVGDEVVGEFTFSARKTRGVAADSGEQFPQPPPGLDGSRFRLAAGPGLAMVWEEGRGVPAMVVARAVAPTAESSGVPFTAARDYLLSLPGLPEDVAAQLRRFSADGNTLPLPVLDGELESSEAEVGGAPATVLTSRDGTMAGVVWVRDGIVNAVAGSLSDEEVLSVARGLRWSP